MYNFEIKVWFSLFEPVLLDFLIDVHVVSLMQYVYSVYWVTG